MNARSVRPGGLAAAGLLALWLTAVPPARPGPDGAGRAALERLAAALAHRHEVMVLVDPAIEPAAVPRAPAAAASAAEAVAALAGSLKEVAWREAYLPRERAAALTPARIAAAARALDRLEPAALAVETLADGRALLFQRERAAADPIAAAVHAGRLGDRPVYLLYSTTAAADGRAAAEQLVDLQRQQLDLMLRVPPEQLPNPALQGMQLFSALPPAAQQQYAERLLAAGDQLWEGTPPARRRELVQAAQQTFATFGAGAGQGAAPPAIRNRLPELQRAAAALARRARARVLVDPGIFITAAPGASAPDAPLAAAVAAVAAPLPGVAAARLFLRPPGRSRPPAAAPLAAAVRTLLALERGSLVLEAPAAPRATLLAAAAEPDRLLAEREARGFEPTPLYLFYSTDTTADRPLPLAERLATVQRGQLALLLRMNPDELRQSMEAGTAAFQSPDPAVRARAMALPAVAAMMAIWFPRAAKDGFGAP
jgi:hypothetical protein